MQEKIILEMTRREFDALFALADEMSITSGMTDEECAKITVKRTKIVNKMLVKNRILEYKIGEDNARK